MTKMMDSILVRWSGAGAWGGHVSLTLCVVGWCSVSVVAEDVFAAIPEKEGASTSPHTRHTRP